MILLLWASLAWGQPQFTQLEEGDVAPFAGRLLNDEAISTILVDQQLASDECQIAVDYELKISHENKNKKKYQRRPQRTDSV